MDTTTHALVGYAIMKTGLSEGTGRWGVIAGVCASVFPDIDLVLREFFGTEFTIRYHRYLTNSLFLIVPFSLLLAQLFVRVSGIRRFWSFFIICLIEILAHTFLDLTTSFGTMILSPFSNRRFALDWLFIVDPYLVLSLLIPLLVAWFWKGRTQILARCSVILAALYITFCAWNHSWALSSAKSYARQMGLKAQEVASIPQPLSPFHWGNYILTDKKIYQAFIDLVGNGNLGRSSKGLIFQRFLPSYYPVHDPRYRQWDRASGSSWVDRALTLEGVQAFLSFARFPVARYEGLVDGTHRVVLFDLRYISVKGRSPFTYVVDFDEKGNVVSQGFLKHRWQPNHTL
jgi:inner membrane protein